MRDEIQGLRAIAVSAVLSFHAWQSTFPAGFLGVDIFFVISGYLMAQIMTRTAVTIKMVNKFYFGRLNRILPLYLAAIIFILIGTILLTSPIEFDAVLKDAWPSILMIPNWHMIKEESYFDVLNKFKLFTHFWSLGVELQFYLTVPLIFFIFHKTQRISGNNTINYSIIITGAAISFGSQWILSFSNQNQSYYATYNRLWQFFIGFFALFWYNLKKSPQFYASGERCSRISESSDSSFFVSFKETLSKILANISLLLLFTFLLFKIFPNDHLNRLATTLLTGLLLSQHYCNPILTFSPLVFLGDISYSVYLIHWPILAIHRYCSPQLYDYKNPEAPFSDGVILIVMSVLFGYILEQAFTKLRSATSSWSSLWYTLVGEYLLCGFLFMLLLSSNGPKYRPLDNVQKLEIQGFIKSLYKNGGNSSDFLKSDQLQLNADMSTYGEQWLACNEPNVDLPSSFPYKENYRFSSICHDKGHGSKQVVVIGNSHGRALLEGLKYHFRDIYSELYVISRDLCTPFMSHTMPEYREACLKFEGVWEPLLQNWSNPIDIIIVGLQYLPDLDPIIVDWKNDEYLQAMETFYNKISNIAKEIVFIPMVHFNWEVEPFMQILQQKLYFGKSLELFHKRFEVEDKYLLNVQRRLDRLKCKKCVKVNYRAASCNNNLCSAIDSKNMSYFRDSHHVTPYGSLVYGELLRKLYEQYVIYEVVN